MLSASAAVQAALGALPALASLEPRQAWGPALPAKHFGSTLRRSILPAGKRRCKGRHKPLAPIHFGEFVTDRALPYGLSARDARCRSHSQCTASAGSACRNTQAPGRERGWLHQRSRRPALAARTQLVERGTSSHACTPGVWATSPTSACRGTGRGLNLSCRCKRQKQFARTPSAKLRQPSRPASFMQVLSAPKTTPIVLSPSVVPIQGVTATWVALRAGPAHLSRTEPSRRRGDVATQP
jgi:hypothetical protein